MVWLWTWGIVTALALIIEFLTSNLTSIWFASGGFVTLFVLALVPELYIVWQLTIFGCVSIALFLITRKVCVKFLKTTAIDKCIGAKFVVKQIQENYTYYKSNNISWQVYVIEGENLQMGAEYQICAIKDNALIAKRVSCKNNSVNKK